MIVIKKIEIDLFDVRNIEGLYLKLKLNGIDHRKLKGKDLKNFNIAKDEIRVLMISNMRELGFKWLDLEKYLALHFKEDYLEKEDGFKFIINMKEQKQ